VNNPPVLPINHTLPADALKPDRSASQLLKYECGRSRVPVALVSTLLLFTIAWVSRGDTKNAEELRLYRALSLWPSRLCVRCLFFELAQSYTTQARSVGQKCVLQAVPVCCSVFAARQSHRTCIAEAGRSDSRVAVASADVSGSRHV